MALLALLIGGGLALVASAQPWWRTVGQGSALDQGLSVAFSGTEATGGLSQALGAVVLAGTLLILALRARGRRVVGVLLLIGAAGVVVVGLVRSRPTPEAVRAQVREVSLTDQFALTSTPWPWVYAIAGVLIATGALSVVVNAARWQESAARFERPADVAVTPHSTEVGTDEDATRPASIDSVEDPARVWRALDEGEDPTLDEFSGPEADRV